MHLFYQIHKLLSVLSASEKMAFFIFNIFLLHLFTISLLLHLVSLLSHPAMFYLRLYTAYSHMVNIT